MNNIPITRRGITATPLHTDFWGNPEFLVDAAIYPGSSGSPVFVFNHGFCAKPNGTVLIGPSRLILVGIIWGVGNHKVNNELEIINISEIKTPPVLTSQEIKIPNNLGVAIHVRKLLDFESLL